MKIVYKINMLVSIYGFGIITISKKRQNYKTRLKNTSYCLFATSLNLWYDILVKICLDPEERIMFQKKQIIYSETQGVCIVDNIVQLPATKGETLPYYVLKSVFDTSKVSYIPVNNHQVVLREIFTEDEARELKKNPELEKNEILKAAVEYVLQQKGN